MRLLLPSLATLLTAALLGCPQEIVGVGLDDDGGTAGGSDASSGSPDGANPPGLDATQPGADAAQPGADASQPGADAAQPGPDAGPLPLQWGEMSAPVSLSGGLQAIHGRSASDVYAVGSFRVFRFDGTDWKVAYQDPGNNTPNGVYVSPTGKVYAAGGAYLLACTGNCEQSANYVRDLVGATDFTAVCGLGETVYAMGHNPSNNSGVIYKRDDTTAWTAVTTTATADLGAGLSSCYVQPDGVVVMASYFRMFRLQSGTVFQETVDFPTAITPSTQEFVAVGGVGARVFAVGSRRRIIERNPTTKSWSFVFEKSGINAYRAIAGAGGTAIAAGSRETNEQFAAFDGVGWAYAGDSLDVTIWGLYAPNENEYFGVGIRSNTNDGVFVHGVR